MVLIVLSILLAGCGGSSSESRPIETDPVPILVSFDMVDSFEVDTATSNRALEVASDIDNGIFDIRWRVNSLEDYQVNVSVNSVADPHKSILVYSEVCGLGLACDQGGNLICQYTADNNLSCGRGPIVSISRLPLDLYLIFEVCDLDSSYCRYRYYPVYME
ncbi:MAG: hypothetical protein ABW044_07705 [Cellvibrio sp.]